MIPAPDALRRLKAGNRRFLSGRRQACCNPVHMAALTGGQRPFAVVLGCSDSRVCPESLFDCDPGDLFVVRVAGQTVSPAVVGSVEFAVLELGVRLVVVMYHSDCGGVRAALDHVAHPERLRPGGLRSVIDTIVPHVAAFAGNGEWRDDPGRLHEAVRAHGVESAKLLVRQSPVLARLVASGDGAVLVADAHLDGGAVDFQEH